MKALNVLAFIAALTSFVWVVFLALDMEFLPEFYLPFVAVVGIVFSVAVYKPINPDSYENESFRMYGIMSTAIFTFVLTASLLLRFKNFV